MVHDRVGRSGLATATSGLQQPVIRSILNETTGRAIVPMSKRRIDRWYQPGSRFHERVLFRLYLGAADASSVRAGHREFSRWGHWPCRRSCAVET